VARAHRIVARSATAVLGLTLASAFALTPSAASTSPEAALAPPPGLTGHGRLLWNLEALLREEFGSRRVWLHYGRIVYGRTRDNFSTASGALCCAGVYTYTFADPTGSSFSLLRPMRPPKSDIGASGGEMPLTIRGAYISCGSSGRWLFRRIGNGPANWKLNCRRGG
jgi:hypothetical protein